MNQHFVEVESGDRFEFGKNWARFLLLLSDSRIQEAVKSLKLLLDVERLDGRTFLDIGSGSGIVSLAARQLGATVHSFDYDSFSVACTEELRRRYFPEDDRWSVSSGSVLDREFLRSLGSFDVVYSWGVLHHTGSMWEALGNADMLVERGGTLVVAIYNDQGGYSDRWRAVKKLYNVLPRILRIPYMTAVMAPFEMKRALYLLLTLRPQVYIRTWTEYESSRGMSRWHDLIDWVGGYPFEVARPEAVFDFYRKRGYSLERMKTCGGGKGCNEFVFTKGGN